MTAIPSPHEELTVTITDLARGGSGVAKSASGEVIFVPFTAPGDVVKVKILKQHKSYSQGQLLEIITPSSLRVVPPCPVFTRCGGCTWQHLPYPLQFETKQKGMLHALKRAGVSTEQVDLQLFPAEQIYHYRNRIQLRGTTGNSPAFGYYEKSTHQVIAIEQCEIAQPEINAVLSATKKKGFAEFDSDFKVELEVDSHGKVTTAWNQKHGAHGFKQVHYQQNELLKKWVYQSANHVLKSGNSTKSAVLLDLYGGQGNLSIPLIPHFSEVHCVDVSAPKIRPNSLPSHFHPHSKSVQSWLKSVQFREYAHKRITVILDPPREGLGNDFHSIIGLIKKVKIDGIILVGCDADSFARDVYRLSQNGFQLEQLAALDLFPQTPHIESLALLLPSALS